jgi:hypothetical protein
MSKKLGIPFISFDLMDPKQLKNELDEVKPNGVALRAEKSYV